MSKISFPKSAVFGVPAVAALLLGAVWAHAGARSTNEVYVGPGSASGSLGSARNSTGTKQYIGCALDAYTGSASVYCMAQNSVGAYGSCYSSSSRMIAALNTLNGDSNLYFSWDSSGTCTNLYITNKSDYAPKTL